jgi:hypothetical protein
VRRIALRIAILLLFLVAVFVGAWLGMLLAVILVGGPHAFRGLVPDVSDDSRSLVGFVLTTGTPFLLCRYLWRVRLRSLWRS